MPTCQPEATDRRAKGFPGARNPPGPTDVFLPGSAPRAGWWEDAPAGPELLTPGFTCCYSHPARGGG